MRLIIGVGESLQTGEPRYRAAGPLFHHPICTGRRRFFVFRRNARAVDKQPAYILFNRPFWPFTGDT